MTRVVSQEGWPFAALPPPLTLGGFVVRAIRGVVELRVQPQAVPLLARAYVKVGATFLGVAA